MKKVTFFISCILTISVLFSGYGKAAENVDTKSQTKVSMNVKKSEMKQTTEITGEVKFGKYYEDGSGKDLTPIQWKVLGEKDGYVLLLSEKIIDSIPFNTTRTDTDWENSTIRKWMNNDFYNIAFSKQEKENMKPGTELNDLVFLLSDDEVKTYLSADSSRTTLPTSFAVKHGVYTNGSGESAWWLRSPVDDKTQTSYISSGGTFGNRPHYVDENIIGFRPAIWIKRSYLVGMTDNAAGKNVYGNTINVKNIWKQYDSDPSSRQPIYYGDHITATGIVRFIGQDSHGTPSMELAETKNGTGYVLVVFGSYDEMKAVSVGDLITIEGDFHILGSDKMVVIKNSKINNL